MNTTGHSPRPSSTDPVRVAVVGAGGFGALHARAFAANPDCELVAVVDRVRERAEAVAAEVGAVAYETVDALLAEQRVHGVSVVTSGAAHLESTLAALSAGASVLLEKPVVTTAAEGATLRAAVDAAPGFVMPAHILRFAAPYRELRHRLGSGAIGPARALSFRRHRTLDHDTRFADVHPVLMTMIHDLDLALWLTGATPARVTARQVEVAGRAQPLAVWAEVETEGDGPVLSFQVSWSLAQGGLPDALEVVGETGALALGLVPRVEDFGAGGAGADGGATVDDALTPAAAHGALAEEIRAFVDGVRFGRAPDAVTLDEALVGIDLAERIIAEASTHPIGGVR
jgi:predicted dehydrogenase